MLSVKNENESEWKGLSWTGVEWFEFWNKLENFTAQYHDKLCGCKSKQCKTHNTTTVDDLVSFVKENNLI